MAAGEGGADSLPPPSATSAGPLPGPERALEEAVASGSLSLAGRRLRHFPGGAARRWDLSDTTQADLSRNRFAEVPELTCHLMSLEGLSLYHNCLRSLPPAIANLQALTYLNVSRNQISVLPSGLCRLPLKVLIASNNRLASLPDDIGLLSSLRQLDVGSNELQSLPGTLGGLESLRDLSVRRNQITVLPEELAELPLLRLDFSCNLVARIPVCYRQLRHLQCILLENNPLQFPPAQVCGRGKAHIFKYLQLAEFARGRPPGFGMCLPEDFDTGWRCGALDSGFNSVDSGSKRWSGNESTDEFSDLALRSPDLARDPKSLQERCHVAADAAGGQQQMDCMESGLNEEGGAQGSPPFASKEPLAVAKSSFRGLPGSSSRSPLQPKPCSQAHEGPLPAGPPREVAPHGGSLSTDLPGLQALHEKEQALRLGKAIESRLNITLEKDLGEALADGVVLCQLANSLCPHSVPLVHLPSQTELKLNTVKSRKNLQSFLAACHQLGLPEVDWEASAFIQCSLQALWHFQPFSKIERSIL